MYNTVDQVDQDQPPETRHNTEYNTADQVDQDQPPETSHITGHNTVDPVDQDQPPETSHNTGHNTVDPVDQDQSPQTSHNTVYNTVDQVDQDQPPETSHNTGHNIVDQVDQDQSPETSHNTEYNDPDEMPESSRSAEHDNLVMKKPARDRTARLQRRQRLALRRSMLSFGPRDDTVPVYRRIRFMRDLSDEDEGNSCDECVGIIDESDHVTVPSAPKVTATKTSRKRKRDEANWQRNKIKKAREAGLEHVNYSGQSIPEKQPILSGTLCNVTCRYKCTQNIDEADRRKYFLHSTH